MSNPLPDKWQIPFDAGFTVIPIRKGTKIALGRWKIWQAQAPTLAQLKAWAANDTNVGIVTGKQSGCFVLDLDSAPAHVLATARGLPETITAKTPRGWHVFFEYPEFPLRNGARVFEGADIRAEGGYVNAAGSEYQPSPAEQAKGKQAGEYRWINSPRETPLAPAPQWLLDMLNPTDTPPTMTLPNFPPMPQSNHTPYGQSALWRELGQLSLATEGTRNDTLNACAFKLGQLAASGQLDEGQAKQALAAAASQTGLDDQEIRDTIESGWTKGRLSPRGANDNEISYFRPEKQRSLPLEWLDDIEPDLDQQWLIKHWLPKQGLGVIFGHPATGKSFFALDMAIAIASGQPWGEYETTPGGVIYLVAEGVTGFRNRVAALKQERALAKGTPFAMMPCAINLQAPHGDTESFIAAIEAAKERLGGNPAAVFIDTVSRTFGGADENSPAMTGYVENCGKVAEKFGCLVVAVHHMPKDKEATTMRGHGSLPAACDTTIRVDRRGERRFAEIAKQKDGPDDLRVELELQQVTIGHSADGEPVTTCIMSIKDVAKAPLISERQRTIGHLGKNAKAIWNALPALLASHGIEGEGDGEAAMPVKIDSMAHREALIEVLASASQSKPESLPRMLRTVLSGLSDKGLIGLDGQWLWIIDDSPDKITD